MKELVNHRHFVIAEASLRRALANFTPGRIVGVCGLPGSGKTFLRNKVMREVVGQPEAWGTGKLPVTEIMALLDKGTRFSAKGFSARAHRSLLRPDLRGLYRDSSDAIRDAYLDSLRAAEDAWKGRRPSSATPEHEHWDNFIELAIDRELKYLLVEHAAALCSTTKDESSPDHMQNLMSVMDKIGAMAILNLVPSGYLLWEGRAEIADRLDRVYIWPYEVQREDQMQEFAKLLTDMAKRYSIDPVVLKASQVVVEIGIATGTSVRAIEELFDRAGSLANQAGRPVIAEDIIDSFPNRDHVVSVWRDVRLLHEHGTPARKEDLLAIHGEYLKSSQVKG